MCYSPAEEIRLRAYFHPAVEEMNLAIAHIIPGDLQSPLDALYDTLLILSHPPFILLTDVCCIWRELGLCSSSLRFSVLYLTMHHHFTISIELDTLHFIRDSQTVFEVKTSPSNAAYLVGETILVEELASLSSTATLPIDLTLLLCRLCHHHLAGIRKLLSGNLVTGL
jgi:hypothetical protein